jgi:universal stress protein E
MADKKILVIVDPQAHDGQPAVERAATLAEHAGAAIELYICDYDAEIDVGQVSTVWIPQPARENLLGIYRKKLETLAAKLSKRGLRVSVDVGWGHPLGETIVEKIVAAKPWLVVKDTHHHGVLDRTAFSSVDWHLIRGCPAPLLLVKPYPFGKKPKVFAAVDPLHEHDKPAELDARIFRVAEELAKALQGELHVVHAYAIPLGLEFPDDVTQAIEKQHEQAMKAFLSAHKVPADHAHLLEGRAEVELPAICRDEGAAVMVMGAVSRRGLDRLFLGSTAERVLDRVPCDLLIVKPEGFKSTLPHSH